MSGSNTDIKVLLVDDEPDILEFLSYNLEKEGFIVSTASDGLEAVDITQIFKPNIIIMDVMMPQLDGIETCERIRTNPNNSDIIIVFLSARNEDYSAIAGYNAGADDYITKPIKPKLLVSKINAIARRINLSKETNTIIDISDLKINTDDYSVCKDDIKTSLTKKEFELLMYLISKPNKIIKREELIDKVWETDTNEVGRTLDVHIRKLREKIGDNHIVTVKGVGYKFE